MSRTFKNNYTTDNLSKAESLSQQRLLTTKDQALNKLRVEIDSKTKDVGLKQNVIHELELDLEKAKQETHRVTMQLQVDSSQNHPAQQRLHTQEERLKANDLLIREVQAETAFKQQKIAELQDQPLQGKKEMTAHREQTRVPESLSRAREASQNKQGLLANEVLANLARIRRHVIAEEELQKPQNDLKTAKATVENLNIRDQDANASIDNLRSKIQESQQRIQNLEDENEDLKKRLEEAEDAYDQQLQLAARAAARRRASFTRVKRERDNDRDETPESSLRRSKRPRTVITTRQAGAIDLTGDGN
jgi:chromosome segregation ATPase